MVRFRVLGRTLIAAAVLASAPAADMVAQQGGRPPRPQQGQQPLSPRDTVYFDAGGGRRVYVDYGRPSMRGRKIMGELVPFGRVWRTGANAATTLVTDVDLQVGNATVPRGTYTLYTIPSAGGWTLIVNRQTGQWGTQYERARDLVRIPMQVSTLRAPVEQFTIRLEPGRGGNHTLALEWESTRAFVTFRPAAPPRPASR